MHSPGHTNRDILPLNGKRGIVLFYATNPKLRSTVRLTVLFQLEKEDRKAELARIRMEALTPTDRQNMAMRRLNICSNCAKHGCG